MQDLFQSFIHKIRINFNPVCSILRYARCAYNMQILLATSVILHLFALFSINRRIFVCVIALLSCNLLSQRYE